MHLYSPRCGDRMSAMAPYTHFTYALMPAANEESVLDSSESQKLVVNGNAPLCIAGQIVNPIPCHL